jgi:hypothetical protein
MPAVDTPSVSAGVQRDRGRVGADALRPELDVNIPIRVD